MVKSLFITFLITIHFGLSSPWIGRVLDNQSLKPLPYTVITHIPTQSWIIADQFGTYLLPDAYSAGDSLKINRYGYQSKKVALPPGKVFTIFLIPSPIELGPITSEANISPASDQLSYTYSSDKTLLVDHRSFFNHLPGVTVRTYGGPGSIGLISVDGGSATHTSVSINDLPLTNNQTGMTDISQIPSLFLQQADLQQSPSGWVGIQLHARPQNEVEFGYGSYGHRSWHASHRIFSLRTPLAIIIGEQVDDGNFPADWRSTHQIRTNNGFHQQYLAMTTSTVISDQRSLKVFGLFSKNKRGNPGPVWSPSLANRSDDLLLIGASSYFVRIAGYSSITGLMKINRDEYRDPQRRYRASHQLRTISLFYHRQHSIDQKLEISSTLIATYDSLRSTAAGNHRNIIIGIEPEISYSSNSGFHTKLSGEKMWQSHLTSDMSWIFTIGHNTHPFSYGFNHSYVNHSPSMNDRYWVPGGNPDLSSEKLITDKCYFKFQPMGVLTATVELYSIFAKDLIQWKPVSTYWQPVNITKSQRRGIKGKIHWEVQTFISGSLAFNRISSTYLVPGDHYGKAIVYTPKYIWTNTVNVHTPLLTMSATSHYMSRIISLYSWPEDVVLPSVLIHDVSFFHKWGGKTGLLETRFTIQNMTNASYEMFRGFPEMGRSYRLSLTLSTERLKLS